MQYDVFISYSRKDSEIAMRICEAFDKVGITYFIDLQGISGGFEFPTVIAEAIINSKIFLYLASENSYDSKFTQAEITFAFNKKTKECILPYIIDGSTMPSSLEFVFSAINWRNIEDHPITTILLDDLLGLLEIQKNNQTKLAEKKKKNSKKIYLITILCIITILTMVGIRVGSKPASNGYENGYEYVDLGLKVKWATFNIGASSPEEYGNYFAWGDTLAIPESENEAYWSDKYSTGLSAYVNDDKLKSEFDVAKSWGKNWRLPTSEECKELLNECDWVQTELNNVSGYKITGPNGNHIFLPFAGMKIGLETMNCSEGGYYWSSNIKNTSPIALFFYHTNKGVAPMNNCGYAIRPVID